MKVRKERVTVTVDRDLVDAAKEAIAEGRADSLSGWVNLALAERAAKDARLRALARAVAAYEREFGEMTQEELSARERQDQQIAVAVRRRRKGRGRRSGA